MILLRGLLFRAVGVAVEGGVLSMTLSGDFSCSRFLRWSVGRGTIQHACGRFIIEALPFLCYFGGGKKGLDNLILSEGMEPLQDYPMKASTSQTGPGQAGPDTLGQGPLFYSGPV